MITNTYLNSPARSCNTCIHRRASDTGEAFDHCRRFKQYCAHAISWQDYCGKDLKEWRPKPPTPPRRSLRQWLADLLWS